MSLRHGGAAFAVLAMALLLAACCAPLPYSSGLSLEDTTPSQRLIGVWWLEGPMGDSSQITVDEKQIDFNDWQATWRFDERGRLLVSSEPVEHTYLVEWESADRMVWRDIEGGSPWVWYRLPRRQ